MSLPFHREEPISQIPALEVLMHLGYEYLTPAEALALRGGGAAVLPHACRLCGSATWS